MNTKNERHTFRRPGFMAFGLADLLVLVALLSLCAAVALPEWIKARAQTRRGQCQENLKNISAAVIRFTAARDGRLPEADPALKGVIWWWYKELVKGELGMKGPSSTADRVFACPDDRGYEDGKPFRLSSKFDYGSYVFNGVNLPGVPNVAGKRLNSIRSPDRTLLVMEWTAHAPLSWHDSRTGKKNQPFYNNALSVLGFVDGHVDYLPIYFDGMNAAYTRDPIPGYGYKYSGD